MSAAPACQPSLALTNLELNFMETRVGDDGARVRDPRAPAAHPAPPARASPGQREPAGQRERVGGRGRSSAVVVARSSRHGPRGF